MGRPLFPPQPRGQFVSLESDGPTRSRGDRCAVICSRYTPNDAANPPFQKSSLTPHASRQQFESSPRMYLPSPSISGPVACLFASTRRVMGKLTAAELSSLIHSSLA